MGVRAFTCWGRVCHGGTALRCGLWKIQSVTGRRSRTPRPYQPMSLVRLVGFLVSVTTRCDPERGDHELPLSILANIERVTAEHFPHHLAQVDMRRG